jgi:hypothetical protein
MKAFAKKYFEIGPVEDIHRSMDVVTYVLHEADDYGITVEVVTYALKMMKENPKMQISDAIVNSINEWVK